MHFLNNFVLNSGLGVTVVFFIYAQTHLGLSAAQSGLVTLPYAIVAVAMIRLGEKATLRFGGKLMLIIGPLFPVIGITIISMTQLLASQYVIAVIIGFVICAIGNGLVATPGLTIAIFSIRMMWLAQDQTPSYKTINRFRVNPNTDALIESLFIQFAYFSWISCISF